jgi:hypothetical protein
MADFIPKIRHEVVDSEPCFQTNWFKSLKRDSENGRSYLGEFLVSVKNVERLGPHYLKAAICRSGPNPECCSNCYEEKCPSKERYG